jgi:hypothetical protein
MNTLQLLLMNIGRFLANSTDGQIFAVSFFFIFIFRIFFKREDRALFFVILGITLYLPIITHLLFGGENVLIISAIRGISIVLQFNEFVLFAIGGLIGLFLAEFFVKSGYVSNMIKKSIAAIIFISLFGSWLYLLIKHW